MEKTVLGLVAALGAAAPFASAEAVTVSSDEANRALESRSIAELLDPAPSNAAAILNTLEAARQIQAEKGVAVAQFFYHHHHHHYYHHHHHYYHHHHHYYHHHHHHRHFPFGWCMTHPWDC